MSDARSRAAARWTRPVRQTVELAWLMEPRFQTIDGVRYVALHNGVYSLPVPPNPEPLRNRFHLTVRERPDPERITAALDINRLYGPDVDLACGVVEPAVDEWEAGTLIPTEEQVRRLATLTGCPPGFFYDLEPWPKSERVFACGPGACRGRIEAGRGGRVLPLARCVRRRRAAPRPGARPRLRTGNRLDRLDCGHLHADRGRYELHAATGHSG